MQLGRMGMRSYNSPAAPSYAAGQGQARPSSALNNNPESERAMPARSEELHTLDDAEERPARAVDTQLEDAYWSRHYWRERYYRPDCEYEDYAPAYCAGYVGWGQYGGSYEDAEKSLCANWERIKGDSRLSLDEARAAMQAAWDHAGSAASRAVQWRRQLRSLAQRTVGTGSLAPAA